MSIIKFVNGKNRGSASLKKRLDYITNPEKTSQNLQAGNGVSLLDSYRDMLLIQRLWGKTDGRAYIHFVISCDKGVSPEIVHEVSKRCAKYYADDFQYHLAVHTNTANAHAHVILNAVNARTGKKFSQSRSEMLRFRDYANSILKEYGLRSVEKEIAELQVSEETSLDDLEDLIRTEQAADDEKHILQASTEQVCHMTRDLCMETGEYRGNSDMDSCADDDEMLDDEQYGWDQDEYWSDDLYEEQRQIDLAMEEANLFKQIIKFFEGRGEVLPDGISYDDAEAAYLQWLESQDWSNEYL